MIGWFVAFGLYAIGAVGFFCATLEMDDDEGGAWLFGIFWPAVAIMGIINQVSGVDE